MYCPQGHTIAQNIQNNNQGEVFLINIHSGGYAVPNGNQPDLEHSGEKPSMIKAG